MPKYKPKTEAEAEIAAIGQAHFQPALVVTRLSGMTICKRGNSYATRSNGGAK
jgi:hypothetical protein